MKKKPTSKSKKIVNITIKAPEVPEEMVYRPKRTTKNIKAWAIVWNINVPLIAKEGDITGVYLRKPIESNKTLWRVVPVTITINTK